MIKDAFFSKGVCLSKRRLINNRLLWCLIVSLITSILKPLIGSNWCDLFTNRTIFALNRIFFSANEEATLKTKQPIRFKGLFKVKNQIAGK